MIADPGIGDLRDRIAAQAAKTLGIEIPATLLTRADRVIE
jgi:hypothetical protein